MEEKYKVIVDHVGRVVVGILTGETPETLTLYNPVIIHVQPGQNGTLSVQSYPYIFMEFLNSNSRNKNDWTFNKAAIAESNVELDDRIIAQYKGINTPATPQPQEEPSVIKLFDE
jgi:hypothetical protein